MKDRFIVLARSIEQDMEEIARLYDALAAYPLGADAGDETLIVVSYYLHNLYNAFENIFENIGAVFENHVDDTGRWHAQLLERMRLDTMPLRPSAIDDEAYVALDELRRFRHVFRHAYGTKLEARRLSLVLDSARYLKDRYAPLLRRFLDFLEAAA